MMRKIGLKNRNHGPKKVSPPQIPGEQGDLRRISGVYSDSGLPAGADAFNSSFESFSSGPASVGPPGSDGGQDVYASPSEGSVYGGSSRGAPSPPCLLPSPPCRPDSLYVARGGFAGPSQRGELRGPSEHQFKEPFVPYRSMSTVSSPTQEQPSPTKGSRNSMSSIDSGWASNPVPGFSSFCSRASNSSLNSDKTSFSNEEVETRPIVQQNYSQRRLSTISNGPPPPKRQSSTSSFTSQPQAKNSLRPSGSQVSSVQRCTASGTPPSSGICGESDHSLFVFFKYWQLQEWGGQHLHPGPQADD